MINNLVSEATKQTKALDGDDLKQELYIEAHKAEQDFKGKPEDYNSYLYGRLREVVMIDLRAALIAAR